MSDQDRVTVRSVAWPEICPWLTILRVFRLAVSLRLLFFGASAILITLIGWWLFAWMFSGDPQAAECWSRQFPARADGSQATPFSVVEDAVPNAPRVPGVPSIFAPDKPTSTTEAEVAEAIKRQVGREIVLAPPLSRWRPTDPMFGTWALLSRPGWEVFVHGTISVATLACLALSGLWTLATWAFFGGAIARIAAVQLASEERVGWVAALRYACSKWLSYFGAPLFPVFGILVVAAPLALVGLIMRADVGWLVIPVGLVWPVFLIGGFIMALLLLGLLFGWPLMWATISAEGTDSFDALSRSYAYVFQRPLRYLWYVIVAAVVGWLGWLLVQNFAAAIVWFASWAASWGTGGDRMMDIMDWQLTGAGYGGSAIIHFWNGCVKWLALGYIYGYFWAAATAIYFLLRRDVDATEMDEVFLDTDFSEQTYELPPVPGDEVVAPAPAADAAAEPPPRSDGDAAPTEKPAG